MNILYFRFTPTFFHHTFLELIYAKNSTLHIFWCRLLQIAFFHIAYFWSKLLKNFTFNVFFILCIILSHLFGPLLVCYAIWKCFGNLSHQEIVPISANRVSEYLLSAEFTWFYCFPVSKIALCEDPVYLHAMLSLCHIT